MPVFAYNGRNRRGEAVDGTMEAASVDAVATQLLNNGITPLDIAPGSAARETVTALRQLRFDLGRRKVGLQDQIFFCRQMYTLLRAGVPILTALRGLRDTAQNHRLAEAVGGIADGLDAGLDLSGSLRRFPDVFSPLFISMVQVGETTGALPEAFLQLALYLEREKDTRERVKQAMRYPATVLIAIAIALVIINLKVIPAFARVFTGFKAQLPWTTRVLIGISDFMQANLLLITAVLVLMAVGFHMYTRAGEGRYHWHRVKLRLPLVGGIVYRALLARFARSLAVTLKAGVPLIQGLTVVSRAADNDYISARILQMREGIERGESITRTAAATGMFPPLVLQMVSVGEQTGAVDNLLVEVAEYYDREVDYDLKNLSAAIEPILIGAVGFLVLILALGVFEPMWDMAQAARGGR